jgi:cleavage and polyadenylation specificity factor subunit 2
MDPANPPLRFVFSPFFPSPISPNLLLPVGPLKGYTLVAHRSGHTLGGSLYTLRPSLSSSLSPASSASSLLYAPLFNHVKEHHLDPTSLLNAGNVDDNFRKMGVVVVGAQRSRVVNVKRIDREKKMLGTLPFPFLSSSLPH